MKRTGVSTLKATLSACLARVKAGDEVLVMERGKPIAKLVPLRKGTDGTAAHLEDLARAGLVRVGTSKLPAGFWKMPRPKDRKRRGLKALLADRAVGR
ncbi:MAG: type II toxin-antitoxin system prevent-host-death family antitoxin [Nitrospira sp.]|nr:type II toxin-antitoxin system prevent-host-death family antitoxin [Nitrospira sp.]